MSFSEGMWCAMKTLDLCAILEQGCSLVSWFHHPLARKNDLVNQVKFLGLVCACDLYNLSVFKTFCTVRTYPLKFFSGFSVGFCRNEEKVICCQLLPWWWLEMTGAFSWNVGKLFSEQKLVTDNLLFIYPLKYLDTEWRQNFIAVRELVINNLTASLVLSE